MRTHPAGDVANLDTHGFGSRTLTWWGTLAFMTLEGTGFALAGASYLYLMMISRHWPQNAPLPSLGPGTWVAVILVASLPLNHLVEKWARDCAMARVRWGMVAMSLLGILPLIIRIFEFDAFGVKWNSNAYGSIVWFLLGLHTTHLLTDVGDTIVLTVLMFTRHGQNPRRFGDVSDNAFYWDFVVLSWLLIYALLYWVPRWL